MEREEVKGKERNEKDRVGDKEKGEKMRQV